MRPFNMHKYTDYRGKWGIRMVGIHERSSTTGRCESSYAELIQTAVNTFHFETVSHEAVFIS